MQLAEFDSDPSDREAHILSLLSHRVPSEDGRWAAGDEAIIIGSERFEMLCEDGVIREVTTWFDEEGLPKSLIPNHRANAIIDAARFTTADRTHFRDNRNQRLKEHQGCNFIVGDLICELPTGTPPPNHRIYDNNAVWFILQRREPSPQMIAAYGQEMAANKLSPERKYNIQASFNQRTPVWKDTEYYVAPSNCNDREFKLLLRLWGITDTVLDGLFPTLGGLNGYATTLQYSREWSELNQHDKDRIWRLPHLPGTPSSACYDDQGRERPNDDIHQLVFGDLSEIEARQDFIRLMKSWEDPPPVTLFYALDQLERSITSSYQRDPALIYFHHERDIFMYMLGRPSADSEEGADEQNYHTELRNLRSALRDGRILSVVEGEPLTLGGRVLFTMEVEFRDRDCYPYFLLRRDGDTSHAAKTPYFFLVHETGADAVRWVNRRRQGAN